MARVSDTMPAVSEPKDKRPYRDSRLAVNLRDLISYQADSVNAWATARGLNQSTINRIANGSMDCTVSLLFVIADATGYEPWQLLHPDFDPRATPPLADERAMRVAAIFSQISGEKDKRRAESIMEQFAPEEPAPAEHAPSSRHSHSG